MLGRGETIVTREIRDGCIWNSKGLSALGNQRPPFWQPSVVTCLAAALLRKPLKPRAVKP